MAKAESRFAVLDGNEIQKLKENVKVPNANTIKSTRFWLNVWRSWAEERNVSPNLEEYPPEKLDEILQRFYAEVRNKNGDHYEPESLRIMIASLERHLRDQKYPFSITKDYQFLQSKQVLEGRARLLREQSDKYKLKERKLTPSNAMSMLEEEDLWDNENLGSGNPRTLCQTMWWMLTKYFRLKGRDVHYSMMVEDFKLCRDERGVECIIFNTNPTKPRQRVGFNLKRTLIRPKVLATGGPRCFVGLFKEFLSRRPPEVRFAGPFYLSIINKPNTEVWYKKQRLGVHTIDRMMKNMIEVTFMAVYGQRFTKQSAQEIMVK